MKTIEIVGSLVKESEKAILVSIHIESNNVDSREEFWMPKSAAKFENGTVIVAEWLMNKIQKERNAKVVRANGLDGVHPDVQKQIKALYNLE